MKFLYLLCVLPLVFAHPRDRGDDDDDRRERDSWAPKKHHDTSEEYGKQGSGTVQIVGMYDKRDHKQSRRGGDSGEDKQDDKPDWMRHNSGEKSEKEDYHGDKSDKKDKMDRYHGDKSDRKDKMDRYHGDREERKDKMDRYHGDREERKDKMDRYHGDSEERKDKMDRYHGDREERKDKMDRYHGDRKDKMDRYHGDREERKDKMDRYNEEEYNGQYMRHGDGKDSGEEELRRMYVKFFGKINMKGGHGENQDRRQKSRDDDNERRHKKHGGKSEEEEEEDNDGDTMGEKDEESSKYYIKKLKMTMKKLYMKDQFTLAKVLTVSFLKMCECDGDDGTKLLKSFIAKVEGKDHEKDGKKSIEIPTVPDFKGNTTAKVEFYSKLTSDQKSLLRGYDLVKSMCTGAKMYFTQSKAFVDKYFPKNTTAAQMN